MISEENKKTVVILELLPSMLNTTDSEHLSDSLGMTIIDYIITLTQSSEFSCLFEKSAMEEMQLIVKKSMMSCTIENFT